MADERFDDEDHQTKISGSDKPAADQEGVPAEQAPSPSDGEDPQDVQASADDASESPQGEDSSATVDDDDSALASQDEAFDLDALDFEPEIADPLAELQRERDSYLESLQRLQADFENYKKRVARQQSELGAAGTRSLVVKLLPALDTLTLALAHATSESGSDEVASVLSQISAAFVEVLAKEGLEVIEPMGKRFDPEEAEAVAHDDGDGEPMVTEVFRVGYRWQGQTLRPAMVKVTGS
ncbi:MAG: nucleotide exchange factor GrpE [Ferrimicrobium sp.]|uniref:Protein GrpE n=2 Tax=Ferrimicrobium acidiphilum TaxID=121039 RepID=A0ABV3Y3B7_9ACTN|nr:nucleotide exchange factor GrpE [Ferrimicrobium sp.]